MVEVIAHRGASAITKFENSMEAFEVAIKLNVDMVEFDVRQTRDKELIVFHDSIFNDVPIEYQTLKEIEDAAENIGFHIPLFEEVLKLCHGKIKMDIEFKETGFEKKAVELLHKNCSYDEYSIKSFFDKVPYKIKKIDPNITTGLLVGRRHLKLRDKLIDYFPGRRLKKCKVDFISPHFSFLTPGFRFRMKKEGYKIYAWTVNDERRMKKLLNRVDGIITDRPDLGVYVRNRYDSL